MIILREGLSISSRESTQTQRLECVDMFEKSREQCVYNGANNEEHGGRDITTELFLDIVM